MALFATLLHSTRVGLQADSALQFPKTGVAKTLLKACLYVHGSIENSLGYF